MTMENTTQNNAGAVRPQGQGQPRPSFGQNRPPFQRRNDGRPGAGGRKGDDRRGPREKVRSEFDQKMIKIRRVARVVTGGRRFNFSVAIVIGNRKGKVGVGLGKANDTAAAIDKAVRDAKKNMITVPLTKSQSIPHEVTSKYSSARLIMIPAKGRGVIAGSSARIVIELAGIQDVTAKILSGSKNKLNIAQAAIVALSSFKKGNVVAPAKIEAEKAPVK